MFVYLIFFFCCNNLKSCRNECIQLKSIVLYLINFLCNLNYFAPVFPSSLAINVSPFTAGQKKKQSATHDKSEKPAISGMPPIFIQKKTLIRIPIHCKKRAHSPLKSSSVGRMIKRATHGIQQMLMARHYRVSMVTRFQHNRTESMLLQRILEH